MKNTNNPRGGAITAFVAVMSVAGAVLAPLDAGAVQVDLSAFDRTFDIAFSGYSGAALENFPVLIKLSEAKGFKYSACKLQNGGDLRFADSDGNLLASEVDTWNPNGESLVWVKVPSFQRSTAIKACYGNANPPSVTAADVWDDNYVGVWHLGESKLPLAESSGVSTPFDAATGSSIAYNYAGAVGGALDLNNGGGRDGGLFAADDDDLDGFTDITIECWLRQSAVQQWGYGSLLQKVADGNAQYSYRVYNPNQTSDMYFYLGSSDSAPSVKIEKHLNLEETEVWHHTAFTYAKTNKKSDTYNDGTNYWTNTGYWDIGSTILAGSARLSLGAGWTSSAQAFAGQIDELRISKVARSADWIKATHDCVAKDDFCTFVFDSSWDAYSHKFKVTFTGFAGSGALADFPVLVRIAEYDETTGKGIRGFRYSDMARPSDGGDLRFADSDGNLLASEVDTWNPNGASLVWVKVPSLTAATKIVAYYGNAAPLPIEPTDVWSSGYAAVWHLNETGTSMPDSTTGGATLAPETSNDADGISAGQSGIVGNAAAFGCSATDTKRGALVSKSASCMMGGRSKFTLEVWSYQDAYDPGSYAAAATIAHEVNTSNSISDYKMYEGTAENDGNKTILMINREVGAAYATGNVNKPQRAVWNYRAEAYDGTAGGVFYMNGTQDSTLPAYGEPRVAANPGLFIGNNIDRTAPYPGKLDEIRISTVVRSADWVKATYDTITSAAFATYGTAQRNTKGFMLIIR